MKLSELKKQWDEVSLIKIFEIPVTHIITTEDTFIIFDIDIKGRSFIAQHEDLTFKDERSKKIPFCKITIDADFSLDENLQELYAECFEKINQSEYFNHRED